MNVKLNFFTKLNHLKIIFSIIHQKNAGNLENIIALLLDNITFLKDQLHQRRQSYIFIKQNNHLFQKRSTDNQLETNLESVKSKKTEKKRLQKTTTKRKTLEKEKVKKTQKQPTVLIKTVTKICHMKLNILIHETAKKMQNTMPMKKKKMLR